jgi:hypothetical protein
VALRYSKACCKLLCGFSLFFGEVNSWTTGGSIFKDGLGFDVFFPWAKKSSHPDAVMEFTQTLKSCKIIAFT